MRDGASYFFFTGGLLLTLLTFRVFLQPDAEHPVGQLNPIGYQKYGLVAAGVMLLSIVVSSMGTHRHIPKLRKPPEREKISLAQTLKEYRDSRRVVTDPQMNAVMFGVCVAEIEALAHFLAQRD